jgi:hypothetical protein
MFLQQHLNIHLQSKWRHDAIQGRQSHIQMRQNDDITYGSLNALRLSKWKACFHLTLVLMETQVFYIVTHLSHYSMYCKINKILECNRFRRIKKQGSAIVLISSNVSACRYLCRYRHAYNQTNSLFHRLWAFNIIGTEVQAP